MHKDSKYTAIQKVRRLNAEHYGAHVRLVDALKKTADLLGKRPRGEYNKVERGFVKATTKYISAMLKLDAKVKKARIATQALDKLEKKLIKEARRAARTTS